MSCNFEPTSSGVAPPRLALVPSSPTISTPPSTPMMSSASTKMTEACHAAPSSHAARCSAPAPGRRSGNGPDGDAVAVAPTAAPAAPPSFWDGSATKHDFASAASTSALAAAWHASACSLCSRWHGSLANKRSNTSCCTALNALRSHMPVRTPIAFVGTSVELSVRSQPPLASMCASSAVRCAAEMLISSSEPSRIYRSATPMARSVGTARPYRHSKSSTSFQYRTNSSQ
mmetsp:Transcript_98131/g.280875  ORF Transcript_98131/g.280875 Transcript_98131/m.280875 type:complete len:230 (-) Transcript_98131:1048-1737(-)